MHSKPDVDAPESRGDPLPDKRERLQVEPRPDEIAAHRFSWKLFGIHPGEVRSSLLEVGAALDRTRTALAREILECAALERSLRTSTSTIRESQEKLMAARAQLGPYEERARQRECELLAAKELNVLLAAGARTRADEIVAAAQRTAKTTVHVARTAALAALRSARATAETAMRAADHEGMAPKPATEQHVSALIALFEEFTAELRGGPPGEAPRAGVATAPSETPDPICPIIARFLRRLKEMRIEPVAR